MHNTVAFALTEEDTQHHGDGLTAGVPRTSQKLKPYNYFHRHTPTGIPHTAVSPFHVPLSGSAAAAVVVAAAVVIAIAENQDQDDDPPPVVAAKPAQMIGIAIHNKTS